MSVQIALQPVPTQTLQIVLGGQNCIISVYLRTTGLYVDLIVNGASISVGVIAQNLNPLVPTTYLGFSGNLFFEDTQGSSNPIYTGLGSRFVLLYLTAADYAQLI